MGDKKASNRFTIQFNASDAKHLKVMDILNIQGRKKAQYIAEAVIAFESQINIDGEVKNSDDNLRYQVTSIVQQILSNNKAPSKEISTSKNQIEPHKKRKIIKTEIKSISQDAENNISNDDFDMIMGLLDDFK